MLLLLSPLLVLLQVLENSSWLLSAYHMLGIGLNTVNTYIFWV